MISIDFKDVRARADAWRQALGIGQVIEGLSIGGEACRRKPAQRAARPDVPSADVHGALAGKLRQCRARRSRQVLLTRAP